MGFYSSLKTAEPDPEVELDLTNSHLHDLDGVEIKPTLQYVDLTANRLREIDRRLLDLKSVHFLCFRQNLLPNGDQLQALACKDVVRELFVNDNQLTAIPALDGFTALQKLDFSYNKEIRSLAELASLSAPGLRELYCAVNKITDITALCHFTALVVLELGSNRIKEIQGLEELALLEELWLGRNRISSIQGVQGLKSLRIFSLQANRLETMVGVGVLHNLRELYLSQNGIRRMEDLALLTGLEVLDLAYNRIEWVQGLETLTQLTDLWLNDNPIVDLDHIAEATKSCKQSLKVVYLENSPAAKSTDAYLLIMRAMLPNLEYLDSTPVSRQ